MLGDFDKEFIQMEGLIQEKVSQKENELNATYDEKLRNYEERSALVSRQSSYSNADFCSREQDLQKQISLARNQLRDLRTSNESQQAKLLDHSQRQGTTSRFTIYGEISQST